MVSPKKVNASVNTANGNASLIAGAGSVASLGRVQLVNRRAIATPNRSCPPKKREIRRYRQEPPGASAKRLPEASRDRIMGVPGTREAMGRHGLFHLDQLAPHQLHRAQN